VSAAKSESTLLLSLWQAAVAIGLAILGVIHLLSPYVILASAFLFGVGFGARWASSSRRFGQQVFGTFSQDIATGFTDMMTGAKDVSDAFSDMAKSVVDDLIKIVNQLIINIGLRLLYNAISGAMGGGTISPGKLTPTVGEIPATGSIPSVAALAVPSG
jgi:hypothetical protein